MSKDTFFLSGIITLCFSLLLYWEKNQIFKIIAFELDDYFFLIPRAMMNHPIATFLLLLSMFFFYKAIKKDRK